MTKSGSERWLRRLELFGTRLGLETTRCVLRELGDPHTTYGTVLVGGTNGKGSTASLLASMATAAGYRTGLFTSPHLESPTERLRLDGVQIEDGELEELLITTGKAAAGLGLESPPTYFESLFLAAALWFRRVKVDLAVFEVGMGGRLDATNICDPAVSIITEISLEHQQYLGSTLTAIAGEKAGIMREGRTVVVTAREPEAVEALRAQAAAKGAHLLWTPGRFEIVEAREHEDWSQSFGLRAGGQQWNLRLSLPGRHQCDNAAGAVAAARELASSGWPALNREAIERGVEACRWSGRLERLNLPGGELVVLDSAHNPQAARVLAEFLGERAFEYTLLFGVLKDKEVEPMLQPLVAGAAETYLTKPPSTRGRRPGALREIVSDGTLQVSEDPEAALNAALQRGRPVVVCGSIYLVGEVRKILHKRYPDCVSG